MNAKLKWQIEYHRARTLARFGGNFVRYSKPVPLPILEYAGPKIYGESPMSSILSPFLKNLRHRMRNLRDRMKRNTQG